MHDISWIIAVITLHQLPLVALGATKDLNGTAYAGGLPLE